MFSATVGVNDTCGGSKYERNETKTVNVALLRQTFTLFRSISVLFVSHASSTAEV